jgi:HAD superfamily hydrolase (TIGR01509 family)
LRRSRYLVSLLFDMDGTLLNTEPCYEEAMGQAIAKLGIGKDYTWDTQKMIVGKPEVVGASLIIENLIGVDLAESLDLTPEKLLQLRDEVLLDMFLKVRPRPGALEILQLVKKSWGLPVAIATSSNRKYLSLKSSNNADAFELVDAIICGDDPEVIGKGKPRPDIYFAAAKAIHVDITKCIVFEDAEAGLKAAKAAGVAAVFLAPDHRLPRELFSEADVIVEQWTDLDISKYVEKTL